MAARGEDEAAISMARGEGDGAFETPAKDPAKDDFEGRGRREYVSVDDVQTGPSKSSATRYGTPI